VSELVTIEINSNGVADVRLNRPEKYNALSGEMFDAITEAGESLMDNKSVRAVVLSGNGRGFCAGLDFSSFKGMAGDTDGTSVTTRRKSTGRTPGNTAQQPGMVWKYVPVPVIAALHGVAFGGGFQVAMGADSALVWMSLYLGQRWPKVSRPVINQVQLLYTATHRGIDSGHYDYAL
jgi:enoyl-CoA hydratase/carnithine racemase